MIKTKQTWSEEKLEHHQSPHNCQQHKSDSVTHWSLNHVNVWPDFKFVWFKLVLFVCYNFCCSLCGFTLTYYHHSLIWIFLAPTRIVPEFNALPFYHFIYFFTNGCYIWSFVWLCYFYLPFRLDFVDFASYLFSGQS